MLRSTWVYVIAVLHGILWSKTEGNGVVVLGEKVVTFLRNFFHQQIPGMDEHHLGNLC